MTESPLPVRDTDYESERTAGRAEIAAVLDDVAAGIRTGAVRLGEGEDAISVGIPDDLSLEIECETDGDEVSLELELEWPTPDDGSGIESIEDRAGVADGEPGPASAPPAAASGARFEVFRDVAEEWRWRLRHRNGNIIATSGEGYTRKHNAEKGLRSVVKQSPAAEITETPSN